MGTREASNGKMLRVEMRGLDGEGDICGGKYSNREGTSLQGQVLFKTKLTFSMFRWAPGGLRIIKYCQGEKFSVWGVDVWWKIFKLIMNILGEKIWW